MYVAIKISNKHIILSESTSNSIIYSYMQKLWQLKARRFYCKTKSLFNLSIKKN